MEYVSPLFMNHFQIFSIYNYVKLPEDNMTVTWSVNTQLAVVVIAVVSQIGLHQGKWAKTGQYVTDLPPLESVWPCWLVGGCSRWRSRRWGWLAGGGKSRLSPLPWWGGKFWSRRHFTRALPILSSISWCAMKCKLQTSWLCKAQWKVYAPRRSVKPWWDTAIGVSEVPSCAEGVTIQTRGSMVIRTSNSSNSTRRNESSLGFRRPITSRFAQLVNMINWHIYIYLLLSLLAIDYLLLLLIIINYYFY